MYFSKRLYLSIRWLMKCCYTKSLKTLPQIPDGFQLNSVHYSY